MKTEQITIQKKELEELKKEAYSLRSNAESELGIAKETYWDNPNVIAGHTGRCL